MAPRGWQCCPIFQTGQLRLGNVWSLAQSHAAQSIGTPSLGSFVVLPCRSAAPPLDRPEIRTERSALLSFSCLSPLQVPLCPGTLKVSPALPPRNLQHFLKTLLASLCRVPGQLSRDIPTRPFRFPASSRLLELVSLPTGPGAFWSSTHIFGEHLLRARHCGTDTVEDAGRIIITQPDPCPYTRTQKINAYMGGGCY